MRDAEVKAEEYTEKELLQMVRRWVLPERVPKRIKIKDTSDFFRVDYDDVVILNSIPHFVRNNEREGRFGLADEQKFWVKRSINLITGQVKILKWTFREQFNSRIGNLVFECVRSPQKEARILDLVHGRPDFVQGETVTDSAGSPLRIMDYIRGKTLEDIAFNLGANHEDFFFNHYPALLSEFIELTKAIRFLHENGEKHGDIRRDHLIKDTSTGRYRWIDFDYNYRHGANKFGYDLFGLGNILVYITGRGDVTTQHLLQENPDAFYRLSEDDINIVFHNRVTNLKKIYPYIPESLNRVLMHFSMSARVYYDDTLELLEDMGEALEKDLKHASTETTASTKDKHLLIAVDQTESSKRAVLYVADFLGGFPGFAVTLLTIIPEPEKDFFENEAEQIAWIGNEREKTKQRLENYRQILIQSGFPENKVDVKLCMGNAKSLSEMIITFQCDLKCCTMVVARHHKSKTEEFLFGSTSNHLIHEAKNCAVWVIE